MKYSIIILSCQKYKNGDISNGHTSKSWEHIVNCFKENLEFIFYGDLNQDKLFIFNKKKKTLSIKTSDEYDNIPIKTWLAYHYWYNNLSNDKETLISFGDDCILKDKILLNKFDFSKINYGGVHIHGKKFINKWHFSKVNKDSYQYEKISPRKTETYWVHEGSGVIFSKKIIYDLLKHFNLLIKNDNELEKNINIFLDYIKKTCWYNDVLIGYLIKEYYNIDSVKVDFFGILGDK